MNRVNVSPSLIRWACDRSRQDEARLAARFPRLPRWLAGEVQPTFRQLEEFARATLTPFGAFFLAAPPVERLPVPDFRTVRDERIARPSAALLETIYQMQRRQAWMREYLAEEGVEPLPFVGTATLASSPTAAAADIRRALGIQDGWAELHATWAEAFLALRRAVEGAGVLVVVNGVVGNNTSQPLDPDEFRGFVLCDRHAPLIFINGADFKSAQMFTLAHELAHLWLGADGVFDLPDMQPSADAVEQFCNRVAAELLIPSAALQSCWATISRQDEPFQGLARRFKVSPMVAARRALDLGLIGRDVFLRFIGDYKADERRRAARRPSGGDFYRTQEVRVGHRFGSAVVRAARAGKLLYQEAYRLTGLHGRTFDQFAEAIGF